MTIDADGRLFDLGLTYLHGLPPQVAVDAAQWMIDVQHDDGLHVRLEIDG
jgi:hypothetical protein